MTDLGSPFQRGYTDVAAALERRIRHGVEQRGRSELLVGSARDSFELPRGAHAVVQATGVVRSTPTVFEPGTHFDVTGNRLIWRRNAERPDEGTTLVVDYAYRSPPSGLTDFNPGSVVGTLVGAVARELTLVHNQIDEAYRRAFIDHASGVALDNVVALLGVERIPATRAGGEVTFSRRRAGHDAVEIPEDTDVADESGRLFATTEPAAIGAGDTETDVPVVADEPGPDGNVNAHTVVVMPTPPPGVDGVTNAQPISGGHDPEPDDHLRERAKHALERAGNATPNAIRNAVLGVEGVQGATVIDHGVDGSVPLGEVRVRHSGGEPDEVRDVVERTRAAGVLATVEEIVEVLVSGTFVLVPDKDMPAGAPDTFIGEVQQAINASSIGESLSVRRLNALAFAVDGLADVAEAQLLARRDRPGEEDEELADPFLVAAAEQVRAHELDATVLATLEVPAAGPADGGHRIDVQLMDDFGSPVTFRDLTLVVQTVATATPRAAPEERDVLEPSHHEVRFDRADTARLELAEVPGFDPEEHEPEVELELSTPGHAGLRPATTTLDLGPQPDEP